MDDGIILNITQDDTQPTIKNSIVKKGGRWTERLKAKRLAKQSAAVATAAQPIDVRDVSPEEGQRPKKRRRVEKPQTSSKQIISSLFTHNPKVEAPATNDSAPQGPAKPSNAPLDSSVFEGIGLDPLLIAHLTNKMDISKPTSIQRSVLPILLSSSPALTSRDVFIQSQTGSGKTLSFLLPIIQDLLPLSSLSYIDRSIGTLAVIIAPTRELAKQTSDVLDILLKMRLRPDAESSDDPEANNRMTRWLVSGLLTGGATRNHEKARLRKGVPILVSTPGRLLDHLQNTSSFNVAKCRWLVLDEADRLMELGFEETIHGILDGLDGRRRLGMQAMRQGKSIEVGSWEWRRRRTILCSATIREDVQKLAGRALSDPLMIKATAVDEAMPNPCPTSQLGGQATQEKFTPPSQLSQKYLIVPLKLRLVTLVALIRTLLAQSAPEAGTKIIVFFSCTDSVDFHWRLFGGVKMDEDSNSSDKGDNESAQEEVKPQGQHEEVQATCSLLPGTYIHRLHGSLSTQSRQRSLRGFSQTQKASERKSFILFCTSVASRGLDLPHIRAVIQYDLPTDGGITEYIHRVGRTARAGRGGEAWCFIAPTESEWVKWITIQMHKGGQQNNGGQGRNMALTSMPLEGILKSGFGGKGQQYESRATQLQLLFEKWVLNTDENAALARNAFLSHVRAYATHPSIEKHLFHIKHLHLGHLAKAFALRDTPASVASVTAKNKSHSKKKQTSSTRSLDIVTKRKRRGTDAEKKMQQVVRAQVIVAKKSGPMLRSGASEFQIAGGEGLERLVHGH